jgi:hypothetical protein
MSRFGANTQAFGRAQCADERSRGDLDREDAAGDD